MDTTEQFKSDFSSLDSLSTDEFLLVIGLRVRGRRTEQGMSRKRLADVSGVSERYLAQLESGRGNMSIVLLRKVTKAIGMSMDTLMSQQVAEAYIGETPNNNTPENRPSVTAGSSHSPHRNLFVEV